MKYISCFTFEGSNVDSVNRGFHDVDVEQSHKTGTSSCSTLKSMPPKPSNTHSRTNSQTVSQTSSHTANSNRQSEVQQQVNEVIGIMHTNIDKVMQRGEKLDSLEEKTSQLKDGASTFKKQAKKVESIMWWKNAKLMCICISVLAIIIGLVAMTVAKNYKMIEQSLGASPSSTPTGTPK